LNRGKRTAAFDQVPSHKTDICSRNTSRPWYSNCAPWNPGDIQGFREHISFIIQIINIILIIALAFYFIFATRECIFTILGLCKKSVLLHKVSTDIERLETAGPVLHTGDARF